MIRLVTRQIPRQNAAARTIAYHFSSSTHFFTYNSRRQRRRRRKEEVKFRKEQSSGGDDIDKKLADLENDKRTAMDIIWPNPYKGERDPYGFPKVRNFNHLRLAIQAAWKDYKWTWKGFRQPGLLLPDIEEISGADEVMGKAKKEQKVEPQQQPKDTDTDDIQRNIQRNTQFVKEHAKMAHKELQDRTGIRDQEDLRQAATEAVKVVTQSVNEFLSGYRKGRDEEVENMLTKYFQDVKDELNSSNKTRRRRKRRTQHRYRRI